MRSSWRRRLPFMDLCGPWLAQPKAAPMAVNGRPRARSVPKQIEYWSQVGKIVTENPDLPFSVIRDILIADQEAPAGEYPFG